MFRDLVKPNLWGVLLTGALAALAMYLSKIIQFNDVLLALIFGIVIGNLIQLPKATAKGVKTSSGLFLELAIVLMAFSINYKSFISLGWQTIVIIVVTMIAVLVSTVVLAKRMNCPGSTGWLVGFGTAICGSSAIAALAPSITKDKSDIGISLAVVNLFGLLGMIAIPFITTQWYNDMQNAVFIGTSLHSVGNVAGAGFGISDTVGEMAVTVKLGRVALLTPALLIFRSFVGTKKLETQGAKFNLPWYLIAFIIISILVSFLPFLAELNDILKIASTFLLAMAMAAIGLKVSFKTLLSSGKKGLIFGALLLAIQLVVIIGLMLLLPI